MWFHIFIIDHSRVFFSPFNCSIFNLLFFPVSFFSFLLGELLKICNFHFLGRISFKQSPFWWKIWNILLNQNQLGISQTESKWGENKSFATLDTFMVRVIHGNFSNNFLWSSSTTGDSPQTEQLHVYNYTFICFILEVLK